METRKLGRGLEDLTFAEEGAAASPPRELEVGSILPNPYQPRLRLDEDELQGLLGSIAENGILQPIIVRRKADGYELVAGERRLQAAKKLGLASIPAVICDVSDQKALELALIENIQRQDLNPIEKAKAYQHLVGEFKLTQEELAARLGQDRSTIANTLRLLELPEELQELVSRGTISASHGRALLGIETPYRQLELARRIIREELSVRQTEELAARVSPAKPRRYSRRNKAPHIRALEDQLKMKLGTRVQIKEGRDKGKIVIEFYSNEDFERILETLGVSPVTV
jgi:ParB family chromosome partitioning protein